MTWGTLRGRYEGGGMVVTAKPWWSPQARKDARLSAVFLEHAGSQARLDEWRREVARQIYR